MGLFWISCFAAGVSLALVAWLVFAASRKRLTRWQTPVAEANAATPFPSQNAQAQPALAAPVWRTLRPWLRAFGRLAMPLLSWRLRTALMRRVHSAGIESDWDVAAISGLLLCASGVGGLLGCVLALGLTADAQQMLNHGAYGGLGGATLMPLLVWRRIGEAATRRRRAMLREFPFLLDLMTLCVEAGLNLHGALRQAAQHGPPGPLRQELRLALNAVRAGHAKQQALTDMAARCDLPALTLWVAAVQQAERLGMQLAPLLRTQAQQQRNERFLRAETLAMQAPVRLLFPLVTCLFPCAFLVIGFPISTLLMQALQ